MYRLNRREKKTHIIEHIALTVLESKIRSRYENTGYSVKTVYEIGSLKC